MYIVNNAVSYCVREQRIYRHEGPINTLQPFYATGGVLMAEGLVNEMSTDVNNLDNPFKVAAPSLNRNGIVYMLLRFQRDDEPLVFNNEVHIANVP